MKLLSEGVRVSTVTPGHYNRLFFCVRHMHYLGPTHVCVLSALAYPEQGYMHFSGISGSLEMSVNSAKVSEKSGKRPEVKVRERSGNLCSHGNLLWHKLLVTKLFSGHHVTHQSPVLYSYCNSFSVRDVHGEFGLINVHLFDILPAISLRKSGIFFCLESGNPSGGELQISGGSNPRSSPIASSDFFQIVYVSVTVPPGFVTSH